jgi:hypothetical protein
MKEQPSKMLIYVAGHDEGGPSLAFAESPTTQGTHTTTTPVMYNILKAFQHS